MTSFNKNKFISFMVIGSFVLKMSGFIKQFIIANQFGTSYITDSYFFALTVPFILSGVIGNPLKSTIIPILSSMYNDESEVNVNRVINNIINVVTIILGIFFILAILNTPKVVSILAPGLNNEAYYLLIELVRIYLPGMLTVGFINTLIGYLNFNGDFKTDNIALLVNNIIVITTLILFNGVNGIRVAIIAEVIGSIIQLIIIIYKSSIYGYKFKFVIDLKEKFLKELLIISAPVIISTFLSEINVYMDISFSTLLSEGSLSYLNYANRIRSIPVVILFASIVQVLFISISNTIGKKDRNLVITEIKQGFILVFMIGIICSSYFVVYAEKIVSILYLRGKFSIEDVNLTTDIVQMYSIGLIFVILRSYLVKIFYAFKNTKVVTVISTVSLLINFILNNILIKLMGVAGLALATTISEGVNIFILYILLSKKLKKILGMEDIMKLVLFTIISVSSIWGINIIYYSIINNINNYSIEFILLIISVSISAILILILSYIFKIEELKKIIDKYLKKVRQQLSD